MIEWRRNDAGALEAVENSRPTVAMLDINLGDSTSYLVADKLSEQGIPYLFASGYGEQAQLPERHKDSLVLQKPGTLENVARTLDLSCRRARHEIRSLLRTIMRTAASKWSSRPFV